MARSLAVMSSSRACVREGAAAAAAAAAACVPGGGFGCSPNVAAAAAAAAAARTNISCLTQNISRWRFRTSGVAHAGMGHVSFVSVQPCRSFSAMAPETSTGAPTSDGDVLVVGSPRIAATSSRRSARMVISPSFSSSMPYLIMTPCSTSSSSSSSNNSSSTSTSANAPKRASRLESYASTSPARPLDVGAAASSTKTISSFSAQ